MQRMSENRVPGLACPLQLVWEEVWNNVVGEFAGEFDCKAAGLANRNHAYGQLAKYLR